MQSTHPFKATKTSSIKIIVGSTNPQKLEAVFAAFEQWRGSSSVIEEPMSADSKVSSQPVGLFETRLGAVNRMQACASQMKNMTEQEYGIAVGIENGIVAGEELAAAMPGNYSFDHWYDVGFVAVRVYQQGCPFEYVATTVPLQIPNDPECGMLEPSYPCSFDEKLAKYRAYIMPLIEKKMDLYQVFSNMSMSRESVLQEACFKAFEHLGNIHFIDGVQQKYDTVLVFGTFDLFHDLHRKLLDDAAAIAKEVIVYVNEDVNKFKRDAVTHKVIADTKNPIIHSPEKRRRHVARYLALRGVAKLKKGKHVDQLQSAIDENYQAGKSVAVFGGCDQFENFPQILNICYAKNTPIITRSRGETDTLLCTTDLKAKMEYQAIAAKQHIDLNFSSSGFFKKRINSKEAAVNYLLSLTKTPNNLHVADNHIIGLEMPEVWQFQPKNQTAVQVTTPCQQPEHILLCLPGRTRCDVGRARKILSTIHHDLVPANLKESVACFIGCYQQEEKTTADDLKYLQENPDYFSNDAMIFTELLILPRIKDNCVGITLWARSYGTVIAIEMENALRYRLRIEGYIEEEIAEIAKEIHVLSISNLAPLERPRLFTTVSVTGYNDKQAQKYIEKFPEMVNKYYRADEPISRNVLSPTHEVVMIDVPERFTELSTGRLIKDPARHYTPNYDSLRKPDVKQQVVNNAAPIFIHEELEVMLNRGQPPKLSVSGPRYF